MKKIITQLLLFAALVFGTKWLAEKWFYTTNLDYYHQLNPDKKANLIFFGTSRTQYGVIPGLFDSLQNGATKSINYGLWGTLPPANIEHIESLVAADKKIKFILIELSDGYKPLSSMAYQEATKKEAANTEGKTGRALLKSWEQKINDATIAWFGIKQSNRAQQKTVNYNKPLQEINDKGDVARKQAYFSPKSLETFFTLSQNIGPNNTEITAARQQYVNRLATIIQFCQQQQITPLFFVPPRILSESERATIAVLLSAIPAHLVLSINAADPAYFSPLFSADIWHLNLAGARHFTTALAHAFQQHNKLFDNKIK